MTINPFRTRFRHILLLLAALLIPAISVTARPQDSSQQQDQSQQDKSQQQDNSREKDQQQDQSKQQQPPAAQPDQSAKQKPDAQKPNAAGQEEQKPDTAVGKTKLEQETGTVNDRILEVMPNYGTVETKAKVPSLSTGKKYQLATAGVLDYFNYPFVGALAAIDQAKNSPQSYGQGWGAYAKRYGSQFADNGIGTYMTTAILPSLLHEDPRYYQRESGGFWRRTAYCLDRLVITRNDEGRTRFNISEIAGNAAAAGISNIYHAPEDRTVGRNLTTWGFLIIYDGLSNGLKEFWPDIRRKVFHKQSP